LITDFATGPPAERDLARLVLRNTVGFLRLDVGRHPDDEELAALVAELCAGCADLREQRARHPLAARRRPQRRRWPCRRGVSPRRG
jgi:hypothetical protein